MSALVPPPPPERTATTFPETADIETSSEDYARRFSGPVGTWLLQVQQAATGDLLAAFPRGSRLLDVGGGHAQVAPSLAHAGWEVCVLGSGPECARRLEPEMWNPLLTFQVGNVVDLPFPDRSFDVVLSYRLLSHVTAWERLVAEMCRVARTSVVFDYPTLRSVNLMADRLFGLKRRIEGNTRTFRVFRPSEIDAALSAQGYAVAGLRPQFLWPMAVHRGVGWPGAARVLEGAGRALGLTALFGSPVIVRADRRNA